MILVSKIKYLLIIILFIFSSCDDDSLTNDEIFGCMDNFACNFDYYATTDNENCIYDDCNGECGGSAFIDECSICVDTQSEACTQDCQEIWGGTAYEDCCGNCDIISENDCEIIASECVSESVLSVCELYYEENTVSFVVCVDSQQDIAGFQFGLEANDFVITSITLGPNASNFEIYTDDISPTSILAFGLGENIFIPAGNNVKLAIFTGTYVEPNGLVNIIPSGNTPSIALSNTNAEEMSFQLEIVAWTEIQITDLP